MRIDVHQHIWTEPLLEALAARESLPFIERAEGLSVLHSAGERPYVIDPTHERPESRTRLLDEDRLDRAVVALSSPIGIEALAREEAESLIDAHLCGVAALGERFAAWGPLALRDCSPHDVDSLIARGCIGVSLPAGALTSPAALDELEPVLERAAALGVPLFIHPGPPTETVCREAGPAEPLWWRALTDYVAGMQAAWLTFVTYGRRAHPDLTVVFSMLAGGAPLLIERLHTRGGPEVRLRDERLYYDNSSYGPAAVEAIARLVGVDRLVYGSDRPVVKPLRVGWDLELQLRAGRLLARQRSLA